MAAGSWDPNVYRERAHRWRDAADKLPMGETRDAYVALTEGYEKLAALIEEDAAVKHPEPAAS